MEDLDIGEEAHGTHFRQGTAQIRPVGGRARMDSRANEWPSCLVHAVGGRQDPRAALHRLVLGSRKASETLR